MAFMAFMAFKGRLWLRYLRFGIFALVAYGFGIFALVANGFGRVAFTKLSYLQHCIDPRQIWMILLS